jgi:hypothetical protein
LRVTKEVRGYTRQVIARLKRPDFLNLPSWKFAVVFFNRAEMNEFNSIRRGEDDSIIVYGNSTWSADEELAVLYFLAPDEIEEAGWTLLDVIVHETLHVRIGGHMDDVYSVNDERIVHCLTPLIAGIFRQLYPGLVKVPTPKAPRETHATVMDVVQANS